MRRSARAAGRQSRRGAHRHAASAGAYRDRRCGCSGGRAGRPGRGDRCGSLADGLSRSRDPRGRRSGASETRGRMRTAQAGQLILFLLTMLSRHGAVNLVEEKANKIIEILAAAIPMDAVFLGKLFAMSGGVAGRHRGVGYGDRRVHGPVWVRKRVRWRLSLGNLPEPESAGRVLVLGVAYFAMAYLLLARGVPRDRLAREHRARSADAVDAGDDAAGVPVPCSPRSRSPTAAGGWSGPQWPSRSARRLRCSRRGAGTGAVAPRRSLAVAGRVGRAVDPARRGAVPQARDEVGAAGRRAAGSAAARRAGCGARRAILDCSAWVRSCCDKVLAMLDRPQSRRSALAWLGAGIATPVLAACGSPPNQDLQMPTPSRMAPRLSPAQFGVLREENTERRTARRSMTSTAPARSLRRLRQRALSSTTKFESGTGWPSFYRPLAARSARRPTQARLPAHRSALRRLRGHLGHVFNDGPRPPGCAIA